MGIFFVLLCDLSQVISVKIIGNVVDFFTNGLKPVYGFKTTLDSFYFLVLSLVVLRILIFIGRIGWRITLARETHKASFELKGQVFDHFHQLKTEDIDKTYTKGVLLNILNSDIGSARMLYGFTIVALLDVFCLGLTAFIGMVMIDWTMAVVGLLSIIYIPYFIKKLSLKEITQYENSQNQLSIFDDMASQVISTIKLQRMTSTGKVWTGRLLKEASTYRDLRLKANYTSIIYQPLMGMATVAFMIVQFTMGVFKVFQGTMSIGEFIAIEGFVMMMMDPLMEIGFVISDWKKGSTSLDRLAELFNFTKDATLSKEGEVDFPVQGDGEVQGERNAILKVGNLNFAYDQKEIIKNFDLTIYQGDRIGIIGEIGTGKSTLVKILSGLNRHHRGEVLFLEKSFDQYSHLELRKNISIVLQKPFLFADTIRNNVSMDLNLSDEEIMSLLDYAGLKEDVLGFKDGLGTQLGEWGINLSGGQKQRLTLARALARKPLVLFLDDCLSAVDTVTENKILENLNRHLKDVTLIWVAHRESTLKYCTRIIEMNHVNN